MRKFLLTLFFLILIVVPTPVSAAKTYRAERYDVDLVVRPGGEMDVTETIVFRFDGGPFTFVFREISLHETDGITNMTASLDGVPLPAGDQPGQVEIQAGDPLKVRWHFAPTSDSTHTFELKYRVAGVARPSSTADTILWKAIPEEHEYAIDASTIRVTYPAGVFPLDPPTLDAGGTWVQEENGGALLTTGSIDADEQVLITLRFSPGSLDAAIPDWQAGQRERNQRVLQVLPFGLAAAVLVCVLGLVLLRQSELGSAVEADMAMLPVTVSNHPPADLPPAIAGILALGTNTPSWNQALATLFDLARRGVIRIEEQPAPIRWLGRQIVFSLQPHHEDLAPHERGLIEMVFQTRKGLREQVSLNDMQSAVAQRWAQFAEPLKAEMVSRGLVDPDRLAYRGRWMGITGLLAGLAFLVFVGLIAVFVAFVNANRWDWLLPTALAMGAAFGGGIVSLAALAMISLYSPFTLWGGQVAQQWKQFTGDIRDVVRGKQAGFPPDLFEPYLLYAAAFGLVDGWIKVFRRQGNVPIPAWFHLGMSKGLAEDWGAFAAMVSSTSSSGADGGGGGGGGSGGGSSGAG